VPAACQLALLFFAVPITTANAASPAFSAAMASASLSRQVPLPLIEATAYVNTRWEWIATPALDGGVGPMNVLPSQMALATSLSGHSAAQISSDLSANLDSGATLLAHYHAGGTDLASWQPAVVATQGPIVASQIFDAMRSGATRTTSTGETITLDPQALPPGGATGAAGAATAPAPSSTDYPPATWYPADPSNYSVANRPHDYPVNMIVIHDIEGGYSSAIQLFQTPGYAASAHYVVGYQGEVAQMVLEKDIAWHAGNWDYNTRAIGIEHEGFAAYNLYTTAEYNASAQLAASICSRWGVPLDRNHVIGHSEVPDPNNPGLFGGSDHHTDPGKYWNWTYYLATAQADAALLPSLPHMGPDPVAVNGVTSVTVTWQPAQSCRLPITGYTVVAQPGGMTMSLPATATSATFSSLQMGTSYTFSVTATNTAGTDTLTSNPAVPGDCTSASVTAISPASPQMAGTRVQFTAGSATCLNPQYQFWLRDLNGSWTIKQPFGGNTWTWDTSQYPPGTYEVSVWANQSGQGTSTWQAYVEVNYAVLRAPCASASVSPASQSDVLGSTVSLTASSAICGNPQYAFWAQYPDASWHLIQGFGVPTLTWSSAGLSAGTYTIHAWVNTQGTGYDTIGAATVTLTDCTSASVNPASSTQPTGSTVALTASSTGCALPRYEFWAQYPSGSWYLLRGFGGATFSWSTSGLASGTYTLHVWANSQGTGYSAIGSATVVLTPNVCSAASLSPATPSQPAGSTFAFTAGSSGCVNPRYAFWVQYPGGAWYLLQGFGSPSFNWNTGGLAPGTYTVHVWANTHGSGYDSVGSATATLTGCTAATLIPASGSSPAGSTITFTAGATGCPNPTYALWLLDPGGTWHFMRAYSTTATWSWSSVGWPKGAYTIHVWANQQGASLGTYEAIGTASYTLS
jgi:hypothetical protein